MSFRDSNNIPIYPGAYCINTVSFSAGGNGISIFPIYGSINTYASPYVGINTDNYYVVLPGFKLVVFTSTNYNTNSSGVSSTRYYTIFDNTSGTGIRTYTPQSNVDNGESCKLYYKNVELNNSYDDSGNYDYYGTYSGTTGTGEYIG
jgi:hypothetical protein